MLVVKYGLMRIKCEINGGKEVHVMADICMGCVRSRGRAAQIVQGTDGNIDACILCQRVGEEADPPVVIRSGEEDKKRMIK